MNECTEVTPRTRPVECTSNPTNSMQVPTPEVWILRKKSSFTSFSVQCLIQCNSRNSHKDLRRNSWRKSSPSPQSEAWYDQNVKRSSLEWGQRNAPELHKFYTSSCTRGLNLTAKSSQATPCYAFFKVDWKVHIRCWEEVAKQWVPHARLRGIIPNKIRPVECTMDVACFLNHLMFHQYIRKLNFYWQTVLVSSVFNSRQITIWTWCSICIGLEPLSPLIWRFCDDWYAVESIKEVCGSKHVLWTFFLLCSISILRVGLRRYCNSF